MHVENIITIKPEEEVLRVARNFWLVYLPQWIAGLFFVIVAFFTMYFLFSKGTWGVLLFAALNLVGAWHILRTFVRWHWNVFIVTNMRVVDVDQRGFFERVVSEAPIDKIQDLSYSVRGILGTLCNFGSVSLQTSGSSATIDLSYARDPKELYHLIVEARAARQGTVASGGGTDKVSSLLEAAGQLSEAEARAFVTALRQAMTSHEGNVGKPSKNRRDLEKDLEWFKDDHT